MKQTRLLRLELNEVPPREFRIFPYGVIETTKGIFVFDERSRAGHGRVARLRFSRAYGDEPKE